MTLQEDGTTKTVVTPSTPSLFVEDAKATAATTPPKPFVKALTPDGKLTIGFSSKMKVPKDVSALNDQKVALRWAQAETETYMTSEGYREFDIRPAVDLQLNPSPDSTGNTDFTYKIVGMTPDDMSIQIDFTNPEAISSAGVSTDSMSITFWSSELLQGENGLSLAEGQTIAKSVIP